MRDIAKRALELAGGVLMTLAGLVYIDLVCGDILLEMHTSAVRLMRWL